MKKILVHYIGCLLLIALFLASCGDDTKKKQQEDTKTTNQLDVFKNTAVRLQETTPISFDALDNSYSQNLLNMQLENVENKNTKVDKVDDYKLEKSFIKGKLRGIEVYHKRVKECVISSIYDDRYAIVISSKQLESMMVRNAIEELPFDKIKN